MMTAVLPLISPEKGTQLGFIAQGLLLVVSGVYYPVSVLPQWMQWISVVSPATYTLEGARRAILDGAGVAAVWDDIWPLILIGVDRDPARTVRVLAAASGTPSGTAGSSDPAEDACVFATIDTEAPTGLFLPAFRIRLPRGWAAMRWSLSKEARSRRRLGPWVIALVAAVCDDRRRPSVCRREHGRAAGLERACSIATGRARSSARCAPRSSAATRARSTTASRRGSATTAATSAMTSRSSGSSPSGTAPGNDITWKERLPFDPAALPTVAHPGTDVTHWFELSIAPWFSMALCNAESYPLNPCKPRSDSNAPHHPPTFDQGGGGSSFLEMQFYPPGFAPFADSISCDNTHWCASLHINDLECTARIRELQHQLRGADQLRVHPEERRAHRAAQPAARKRRHGDAERRDAPDEPGRPARDPHLRREAAWWRARARDEHPRPHDRAERVHDRLGAKRLHADVDRRLQRAPVQLPARVQHGQAAEHHPVGGARDQHLDPVRDRPLRAVHVRDRPDARSPVGNFTDTIWQNCTGPVRERGPAGRLHRNPEVSDAPCWPNGFTHGGHAPPNEVAGCIQTIAQNGDLDYDGTSYWPNWPDSTTPDRYPSPFLQQEPTTRGHAYKTIQFQTNAPASEATLHADRRRVRGASVGGAGEVLPVLDAGQGARPVRVGVRADAQRQHVRRHAPVRAAVGVLLRQPRGADAAQPDLLDVGRRRPRVGAPAGAPTRDLGPRSRPDRDPRPRRRGARRPPSLGAWISHSSQGRRAAWGSRWRRRSPIAATGSPSTRAARTRSRRPATALAQKTAVTAIAGDVADPRHREELVAAAVRMGRLRLLVNNASVLGPSPQPGLADYPLEVLDSVYRINVLAPLGLIQLALPALAPDGGVVLNITSDAAVENYPGWGGYGSAKAALEQLSNVLAAEHPRPARVLGRPRRHAHAACTRRPSRARTSPTGRGPRRACPACCG